MVNYVVGNVTVPKSEHKGLGGWLVAHLCNDANGFGAGCAKAVALKWPRAKSSYHAFCEVYKKENEPILGETDFIWVANDVLVANMVAQRGYGYSKVDRVNYNCLADCLADVNHMAEMCHLNVVMPKIGSGLAKGNWNLIESLIEENMKVPVYIYDFWPHDKTERNDFINNAVDEFLKERSS